MRWMILFALGAVACGGVAKDLNGCPSIYDGTYTGTLQYDWEDQTDTSQTGHGSFGVSLTFKCDYVTSDTVQLTITHAMATDPFFGCTLGGCTPDNLLSFATLPAVEGTVGFTGGIRVYMQPSGTNTGGNWYTQSKINVAEAHVISAQPGSGMPYYAFGPGAGGFPSEQKLAVKYYDWSFARP